MEDIDKLFEAKREQLRNARRQEELRRMIERQPTAKHIWRLPVWIGSAAAVALLFVFVLPQLLSDDDATQLPAEPMVVAMNMPKPVVETDYEAKPATTFHRRRSTAQQSKPSNTLYYIEDITDMEAIDVEHEEATPVETAEVEGRTEPEAPRIHRRTSTSMVSTTTSSTRRYDGNRSNQSIAFHFKIEPEPEPIYLALVEF